MPNPRVFIGPIEVAGVLWDYRCGLRKLGVDAQLILWFRHRFGYDYDELFGIRSMLPERAFYHGLNKICGSERTMKIIERRQRDKITEFIERFDVFHFGSGLSLTPFNADVKSLKGADKKIVMTYFGCDIRCTSSQLPPTNPEKTCTCKTSRRCIGPCKYTDKMKMLEYWSKNSDVIFAGPSNSRLLDFLNIPYKFAISPIDIDYWKKFDAPIEKDKLLVVHAPSSIKHKGTARIIEVIQSLQEKYNFDFRVLQNISNEKVREWFNVADIVIDQLGYGWYGRISVESMSMGNPTLCSINEKYKGKYKKFSTLPLVNITSNTLFDRLEELINDPELRRKVGKESRRYAENVHSDKAVCKELLDVYGRL